MPSQKILGCHTKHRMQRLLWSPEYESYMNLSSDGEPIVLVESPFVIETKNDGVDKMVYVGLTTECLLIAEEKTKKPGERENLEFYEAPVMTTACRQDDGDGGQEGDWDLQELSLKYLYPLQHVRLSIRQYREEEGEHVLRLRIGEETEHSHLKTLYLELAGRHREVMWSWWKNWIEDLEERRKEQRHRIKTFNKKIKPGPEHRHVENVEFGELNLDYHRDNHGLVLGSDVGIALPDSNPRYDDARDSSPRSDDDDDDDDEDVDGGGEISYRRERRAALATGIDTNVVNAVRRKSLQAWHIEEHKKRAFGRHAASDMVQHDSTMDLLTTDVTEADIISRCTQYGVPIPTTLPGTPSFYGKIGLPVPDDLGGSDDHHHGQHDEMHQEMKVNSCSSLEDILSVGSLVDSDVDWHHAVSTEVNDRLELCVGDLFEKANVKVHEHGHVARERPTASDSTLDKLLEFEETNLSLNDDHHHFAGIDKEQLHHTYSLPDILEGEAAFLEDDYEASQITQRQSFVAMDIANENKHLQAHILNGHVLLVTKKELRLEKELIKFREEYHDLDFTTCKHKGRQLLDREIGYRQSQLMVASYKSLKKKRGIKGKTREKFHLKKQNLKKGGAKAKDFIRHTILHVDDLPEWAAGLPDRITMISDEICPEAIARELTLIDKELFLMVHESELVNCMWMKADKHSKATNVMNCIEFFERVVRTVSAEIVNKNYDWARAKAMAFFTKVAKTCYDLQNFHSLKAILCGMQVPSIYRLKYSWSDFEELHPDEYKEFTKLAHLMADEGCSPDYFAELKQAESNPPYLPFLGAFLKNVTNMFTIKDDGGTRTQHKRTHYHHDDDEEQDDHNCQTSTITGGCYHPDEEEEDASADMEQQFASFFKKVHDTKPAANWVSAPTHNAVVHKSPAYLMNETLFQYQISAIQYKWVDLPQVRDFWLRKELPDEVTIWKRSKQKEDVTQAREERQIRMERKKLIEKAYREMMERKEQQESLAEVASAKTRAHESKHGRMIKNALRKHGVEKEHRGLMDRRKKRLLLAKEATDAGGRKSFFQGLKKKR